MKEGGRRRRLKQGSKRNRSGRCGEDAEAVRTEGKRGRVENCSKSDTSGTGIKAQTRNCKGARPSTLAPVSFSFSLAFLSPERTRFEKKKKKKKLDGERASDTYTGTEKRR
jgi:hypothetical protein